MEKQTPPLEYLTPRRGTPYSERAIACFVLGVLSVSAILPTLLLREGALFLCASPIAAMFSIVYGVMAFSHFPDDRDVMYRGRWMAVVGLTLAGLMLVGLAVVIVYNMLERV